MFLEWSLIFLVVAIVADAFGFTRASGVATDIAKVLFAIFLIVFLLALIF